MPAIKTRELNKGTIRTHDRTADMMHRFKNVTTKTRNWSVQSALNEQPTGTDRSGRTLCSAGIRSKEASGGAQGPSALYASEASYQRISAKNLLRQNRRKSSGRRSSAAEALQSPASPGSPSQLRATGLTRGPESKPATIGGKQAAVQQFELWQAVAARQHRASRLIDTVTASAASEADKTRTALRALLGGERLWSISLYAGGSMALLIVLVFVFFGGAFYSFSSGVEDNDFALWHEFYLLGIGIGDDAIVQVAAKQVGNTGGEKFWRWYGYSGRVDWCCIFVSWCANQCGYLETGRIPKFAAVSAGIDWFRSKKQWHPRGYLPKEGDLIFIDWQNDGVPDHVGIVENADAKTVYTIEGNSSDMCRRQRYSLNSRVIYGYGTPRYNAGSANQRAINGACEWAIIIANDNRYQYGEGERAHNYGCPFCGTNISIKGKGYENTYCCNPFVTAAFAHGAGDPALLKACKSGWGVAMTPESFYRFGRNNWKKVARPDSVAGLRKGDVLVRSTHVALYVGNGRIAHAAGHGWTDESIRVNDLSEIALKNFDFVMRYEGDGRY